MKSKNQIKSKMSFDGKWWAKVFRLSFLILALSLVSGQMLAQSILVKGTVKDQKGDPVIGATVAQRNVTSNGTITDINGNFQLKVPRGATLVISYIGYVTQTVAATPNKQIVVVLAEDTKVLEDVVVVAYGTQKKVSVTGAISSVSVSDIKKSSAVNLSTALQGRITGLSTWQNGGGQPGRDTSTMYLRGVATLNGASPLVLIDGVAYQKFDMNRLDPNEVENVSVLKDASATAIFGVRGANGVIIINTRHGKSGKPELSVSVDQSFTSFSRRDSRLHSWDFMKYRNEAMANDGSDPEFSDELIAKFKDPLHGLDKTDENYAQEVAYRNYLYCDHYWVKEFFKDSTPQTKVNVNFSGGSDRFHYFINANYIHQGGNLKTESKDYLGYDSSSWMNRWNFRSNMDYNVTKTLKATLNIGTYFQTWNQPGATSEGYGGDTAWMMRDLFYQAEIMRPFQAGPTVFPGMGIATGTMVFPDHMDRSAFLVMNRSGFWRSTTVNLTAQFALDWDLSKLVTPGLSIRGMVSYDEYGTLAKGGNKSEEDYYFRPDYNSDSFEFALHTASPSALSLWTSTASNYSINAQASLNYHRTFGKVHDVSAMLLGQRDFWESGSAIPYNVIGLSGRAAYAYDSRYLAEFDFGYNGSEQFNPDKRFGFFPAGSIGWIVSNESFMKQYKWLDNLKLRYSWGKVGNDKMGGNRFIYLDNVSVSGGMYVSGLGTDAYGHVDQGLLGNHKVTWETATKQNYGFDLGLLKMLTLSFNYYTEKRSDILMSRSMVPAFQGVSLGNIPLVNIGRMKNSGVEFELAFDKDITKDFHLHVSGNVGTNKNKVLFADEPMRTDDYVCRYTTTGYRYGQQFGYKIDYASNGGYFISQEDIDNSPTITFGKARIGDFKYKDLNGDGVIDAKDQVPIKWSGIPGLSYGLNIAGSYKGFDFAVFFTGLGRISSDYNGFQNVLENIMAGYYYKYQRTAFTLDRWQKHQKITYPALTAMGSSTSQTSNDFFIQNRSFTRLKNVELGYTLPKRLLNFAGVKSCRLYVSGQNLYVWDHLHTTHIDPEQADPIGYPITKMVNFGVNVNF